MRGIIREAIALVVSGKSLTMEQSSAVMTEIMEGSATPAQISAFVTALRDKGETVDEITGLAKVMREKATHGGINITLVAQALAEGFDGVGQRASVQAA